MDAILGWIEQHHVAHTTLVGGFIGLEVMEALSERGISVTLLEMGEQVMAPVDPEMASALHQEIRSHGVDLRLRTALTEVLRTDGIPRCTV
jgi:NADPH-dependent 2,4-dienoyl-CoA reductase/sulfur reductase-like enzyme